MAELCEDVLFFFVLFLAASPNPVYLEFDYLYNTMSMSIARYPILWCGSHRITRYPVLWYAALNHSIIGRTGPHNAVPGTMVCVAQS